jgi:hypothetical protein
VSVVFLCVGAAKAGTSWLFDQLAGHPECHFRAIKELHYFDAIEAGRLDRQLEHHRRLQSGMMGRLARSGERPTDAQAARLADRADWLDVLERGEEDREAYLRYLNAGAGQAAVVGEMTPAYALLPEARLAQMASMAPDVRMLFLLRDPVERLWSHVRMIAARRDSDGIVTARRCANILNRVLSGDEAQIVIRSDYAGALRRLMAAVPGGRLLIEVFEDMVAGPGLARICAFLGIAPIAASPVAVHVGQQLDMTVEQRQAATAWLQPQYDAAAEALGYAPAAWIRKG